MYEEEVPQTVSGRIREYRHYSRHGNRSCLVSSHGLFGTHNHPIYLETGERLKAAGIDLITFNYSGNRINDRLIEDRPLEEKQDDLGQMVEFARDYFWYDKIGILGFSYGGVLGLLADPPILITVSTPTSIRKALTQGDLGIRRIEKKYYRLGDDYLHKRVARQIVGRDKDTIRAIQKRQRPHLAIHGTEDEVVPFSQVDAFRDNPYSEIHPIEGANHNYTHFRLQSQAVDIVVDWARTQFGKR